MSESLYTLQLIDDLKRRVDALEAEVRQLSQRLAQPTPVAVAPPVAVGGGWDVVLHAYPDTQKIMAIKLIREFCGVGLAEAKGMSESLPCRILAGADDARADAVTRALTQIGASCERTPAR